MPRFITKFSPTLRRRLPTRTGPGQPGGAGATQPTGLSELARIVAEVATRAATGTPTHTEAGTSAPTRSLTGTSVRTVTATPTRAGTVTSVPTRTGAAARVVDAQPGRVTVVQPRPVEVRAHTAVAAGSIFARRAVLGRVAAGVAVFLNQPQPRDKITVPISPTSQVDARTVFEDPAVAGKRVCLPLFRLDEQTIEGKSQFRVALEKDGLAWRLTVFFSTGARAQNAEPLPFKLSVVLRFVLPTMSSVTKEMPLRVEQEDADTWKATLAMDTTSARDQVYRAMTEPDYRTRFVLRCGIHVATPEPKATPEAAQLYREASPIVEDALDQDPFSFDPALHPYIFREVTNVSRGEVGFTPRLVRWKDSDHYYFQDGATPYLFYYMPDEIRVTRRPDPPFTPNLLAKFASEDGSLDKMRASLEYVAAPVFDSDRLCEAANALKAYMPSPLPQGVTDPVFQPLVVSRSDQLKLSLALPGSSASGSLRQDRPGTVTNLTDAFSDVISGLPLAQFQELYDALFGKSAVLLTGYLWVGGEGQRPDISVPFNVRLNDLYGEVLEETEIPEADGSVGLTLRNRCESPVVLRSMPVEIQAEGQAFPARVEQPQGGPFAFPVRLAPEEEVALRVVANSPLPAGSTPDAVYDLDDLVVEPDSDAVWQAILDASVPAEYMRKIRVMAVEEWFSPATDVLAIGVDLKNGTYVTLRRGSLEADATVNLPLSDVVLRKVQEPSYTYTLIVIRSGGQTRSERTDTLDLLFPDLST